MSNAKIVNRYAKSLLENTIEKSILTEITKDVSIVLDTLNSSNDLRRLLNSPVVKSDLKKSILTEIFSKKISNYLIEFLDFVVDKKRETLLLEILNKFMEFRDDYLGIVRLDIKTAFEITEEVKNILVQKFQSIFNKNVEANFSVNNEIIGGFVANYRDIVYDASIKHQLEKLKKSLISGSISLN